jgi:hypothetical protein
MAKQYFMPKTQDAYVKWHDNLKNNVTANTTGATAADVTQVAADNADLHAKMDDAMAKDNASKASHANLNTSIGTSKTNARALAGRIKASTGYTTAIGDALQLARKIPWT